MAIRKRAQDEDDNADHVEQPRAEQPGERRGIWMITRLEGIQEDPEQAIDARAMFAEMPALSQRYLAMLLREGPVANALAAQALKVGAAELEEAVLELEQVIKDIIEDEG